jgi:RNA polymerase sigma factor (sigma-70 family)
MHTRGLKRVLDQLHCLDGGGLSDAQLLGRFLDGRDEAAFAALVRRHGSMVLGVCRRILGHAHDAEDAFQATFLVLVRRAASLVKREAVASFLYGVAYRTALEARAAAARRHARERQVDEMPHPEVTPQEIQDWRPLLDRELNALPQKYKGPVILCDLEGKTRREAARQLGVSEGTLSSRLARARCLLARRLVKHGVALSGGALAVALSESTATAAVPAAWMSSTIKAAALVAAGQAAAVTTPVAALMNEVAKAMLMTKLKVAVATVMVAVLLGAGGLVYRAAGQGAAGDGRQAGKPRTELEALRHEVELLRFNLEVVLEKCRAQEAELGKYRAQQAAAKVGKDQDILRLKADALLKGEIVDFVDVEKKAIDEFVAAKKKALDPTQEVEVALKMLLEAQDEETKHRAAQKVEQALQKLRQQLKQDHKKPDAPRR